MAYITQIWNDNDPTTPITAARLVHIENGIVQALSTVPTNAEPNTITVANGSNTNGLTIIQNDNNSQTLVLDGNELAAPTLQIIHSGSGTDPNASGLTVSIQGPGTAADGLMIEAPTSGTTGTLFQISNNGHVVFALTSDLTDATLASPLMNFGPISVRSGTTAPVSGTYTQGSQIWHSAPVAGGNLGWVCVSDGTPGTWKQFGAIEV